MVRTYKKLIGRTQKFKYSEAALQNAVQAVITGRKTLRKAEEQYGVPRNTISVHVNAKKKGEVVRKIGGQPVYDKTQEHLLVEAVMMCAEWGFPLQTSDLKDLVQDFNNRKGVTVKCFKDNRPGNDWMYGFLRRHPEITQRLAGNIKRKRAEVNEETINQYFDNLTTSIEGIPPENLVNFDETNFCDDPESAKVLVKRGCRHPERVIDVSKSATSVMIAVTGSGKMLPPFVVYKSKYLYPTWIEGGPEGTRFSCTKSGWFEINSFEEFFIKIILPYLKDKPGKKAIMGDNLASHLSYLVISLCAQHGILFILLPPNATHICQPLDVSFFRPLKRAWRKVLTEWKKSNRGVVPKSEFPKLLKAALELIEDPGKNIRSGFKACGLIPLDREEVLKKIPRISNADQSVLSEALLHKLNESRSPPAQTVKPKRGKRLLVEAGKSIGVEDFDEHLKTVTEEEDGPETADSDIDDPASPASPVVNKKKPKNMKNVRASTTDVLTRCPKEAAVTKPQNLVGTLKEKDYVVVKFVTEEDQKVKYYAGELCNILNDVELEVMF